MIPYVKGVCRITGVKTAPWNVETAWETYVDKQMVHAKMVVMMDISDLRVLLNVSMTDVKRAALAGSVFPANKANGE